MPRPGPAVCLLAIAWVLVPAMQYCGTVQRTHLQVGEPVLSEWLAGVDLVPLYALLLCATTLCALRTIAASRHAAQEAARQERVP